MTGATSQYLKAILAVAAVVVIFVRFFLRRRARARTEAEGRVELLARIERHTTRAFLVLAVVAVGNYFGFSTENLTGRTKFSGYDLIHYYLNAKYFDELGYVHLYEAVIVADSELKDRFRQWHFGSVRDLETSQVIPTSRVYANAERTKALFTPRRWAQFKKDFRFLQRTMTRNSLRDLLNDHGYNGPPLLQTFAGWVANQVPVRQVKLLCHVETLLILLMFGAMWRVYGVRLTAVAVLWYAVDFSARWPGIGFGIFRIDWFIALVLGCILLEGADLPEGTAMTRQHKGRLFGAGLLFAYAAMMKIFPAVWLFGLGVRSVWVLATRRRLDRVAVFVFAGVLTGVTVFSTASWMSVGKENIQEFAEDISEHLEWYNLSSQRMGFGVALAYRGETKPFAHPGLRTERFRRVGELSKVRYAIALGVLLLLAMTIRGPDSRNAGARTGAAEASQLGFIPFYFLNIASHYYWIHRMTMVLHHGRDERDELLHAVGLSALFLVEALTNAMDQATHFRYGVVAATSVALGLYCAYVIGARLLRTVRGAPTENPTPVPTETGGSTAAVT